MAVAEVLPLMSTSTDGGERAQVDDVGRVLPLMLSCRRRSSSRARVLPLMSSTDGV